MIGREAASWDLYERIPVVADRKTPGWGRGRTRLQIKQGQYGARTTSVFLRALREEILSRTDVLDHLGITDSDLDAIHELAG